MAFYSNNRFDLLSEDTEEPSRPVSPAKKDDKSAKKKDVKTAKPATTSVAKKDDSARPVKRDYPSRGRGAGSRGGLSAPRPARPEGSTIQDTGSAPERSNRRETSDQPRADHRNDQFADHRAEPRNDRQSGGGRGRGGRGGREFDRRSANNREDSDKKDVAGAGAWGDALQAGIEDADIKRAKELGESPEENGVLTSSAAAEEDNEKSYAEYQAELSAKRAAVAPTREARKANEGSDESQWLNATQIAKTIVDMADGLAAFITGSRTEKVKPKKEKTQKVHLDIQQQFTSPAVSSRGGRNEGGSDRGGRGGFGERGGRGSRGGSRGGRGGNSGDRGGRADRGSARGNHPQNVDINDASAFPSLKA